MAVMPMTTPRTVSDARILFERSVSHAMPKMSLNRAKRIVMIRRRTVQSGRNKGQGQASHCGPPASGLPPLPWFVGVVGSLSVDPHRPEQEQQQEAHFSQV